MHLARFAIKLERQLVFAADQHHRLGAHLALHALNALRLFRAQVERPAQAVLGDHHRNLTRLGMCFVRGGDYFYAVLRIKIARGLVVNVGQIRELFFGIRRRRLCCIGAFPLGHVF